MRFLIAMKEHMIDEYEAEFKAKVMNLQESSQVLKQQISDKKEELDAKLLEIVELKKMNDTINLKNASQSLSEAFVLSG